MLFESQSLAEKSISWSWLVLPQLVMKKEMTYRTAGGF
jgi:hypothetical protein